MVEVLSPYWSVVSVDKYRDSGAAEYDVVSHVIKMVLFWYILLFAGEIPCDWLDCDDVAAGLAVDEKLRAKYLKLLKITSQNLNGRWKRGEKK